MKFSEIISIKKGLNCQTQILNSTTTTSFLCIIAPTALHRLANSEHGELVIPFEQLLLIQQLCMLVLPHQRAWN